jgi:hypothetical protein
MAAFGLGIATILMVLALVSRPLFLRIRDNVAGSARAAKFGLGALLLLVGLLILTGWDRQIEAAFVSAAPDWLVQLTTMI